MEIWQLLVTCGVPTTLVTIIGTVILKQIDKREKRIEAEELRRTQAHEKKDEEIRSFLFMTLKATRASIVLSEATAKAVQRIPDAHCNGDMHAALDYASKTQAEENDFLLKLGVQLFQSNEH